MIHCTFHTIWGNINSEGQNRWPGNLGAPAEFVKTRNSLSRLWGAPENRDVIGGFLFIDFPSISRKINQIEKKVLFNEAEKNIDFTNLRLN